MSFETRRYSGTYGEMLLKVFDDIVKDFTTFGFDVETVILPPQSSGYSERHIAFNKGDAWGIGVYHTLVSDVFEICIYDRDGNKGGTLFRRSENSTFSSIDVLYYVTTKCFMYSTLKDSTSLYSGGLIRLATGLIACFMLNKNSTTVNNYLDYWPCKGNTNGIPCNISLPTPEMNKVFMCNNMINSVLVDDMFCYNSNPSANIADFYYFGGQKYFTLTDKLCVKA